tara:strand:- start:1436 stop:2182 length:747 start_codon:yes stop_codon:yes gene_type:complete
MRCFSKKQTINPHLIKPLGVFFLTFVILIGEVQQKSFADTQSLLQRAFHYLDIYHFKKPLFKSTELGEIQTIKQPFRMSCVGLNRIILPFYLGKKPRNGKLVFKLYRADKPMTPLFAKPIDVSTIPDPKRIGTHREEGSLYHFWIPKHNQPKNQSYFWTLSKMEEIISPKTGIYFSKKNNPQLTPVRVDQITNPSEFAAFYAYCQYDFRWYSMTKQIISRISAEKYFIGFHLTLIFCLVFYLKKLGST